MFCVSTWCSSTAEQPSVILVILWLALTGQKFALRISIGSTNFLRKSIRMKKEEKKVISNSDSIFSKMLLVLFPKRTSNMDLQRKKIRKIKNI